MYVRIYVCMYVITCTQTIHLCTMYVYVYMHMYRFMAGVIPFKILHRFEIALWRACHAKVFVKHARIMSLLEDPLSVSVNI